MTQLQSVTCHTYSVTHYPTQVNTPRLHPSQTGWYSIYRPFKDGGLSKPSCGVSGLGGRGSIGSDHYGPRFSTKCRILSEASEFACFRGISMFSRIAAEFGTGW